MLIRRVSEENFLWGAPRIHGELLKLGIEVCQTTVAKYMRPLNERRSPAWRSFLRNHQMADILRFTSVGDSVPASTGCAARDVQIVSAGGYAASR